MKTQKIASAIVGGLAIVLVQAAAFNVTAQVTRQESTNQLKKAVYTLAPSTTAQYIKQWIGWEYEMCDTNPYYMYLYYAMVPIPEITVSNMPSVQVWRISPGSQGWTPMPAVRVSDDWNWSMGPSFYVLTNGVCGVLWKTETHPQQFPQPLWQQNNYCPSLEITNIFAISNLIVVVYETPSISAPFKLDVAVSPSGVSLTVPTTTSRTYAVEYTPVLPPTNSWNILVSNIVGSGGPVSVTDSNGANQRFYRALEQ